MRAIYRGIVFIIVMQVKVVAETVMVLAGTSELGQYIVEALCRDGYDVMVAARDEGKFKALELQWKQKYPARAVSYLAMDYTRVEAFDVSSLEKVSLVGVVVIPPRPVFNTPKGMKSAEEWESVFELTYVQPLSALQKVSSYLQTDSSIVLFSGVTCRQYSAGYENTNVIRMAWAGEVKNLMYQLADRKIRVNVVSPGLILTPFNQRKISDKASERKLSVDAYLEEATAPLPLKRFGQPEEVADVVAFLISRKSRYVNGVNLIVDGGESLAY